MKNSYSLETYMSWEEINSYSIMDVYFNLKISSPTYLLSLL